jgi:uncharacterized protein (TIGR00266 family)
MRVNIEIRQQPSFSVARVSLGTGETCLVESGAMYSMSGGMDVQSKSHGGAMKSLGRAFLAGESLFISSFTAPEGGGWVDVAPNLPGDIKLIELDGSSGWAITRGGWLASSPEIKLDTKWAGLGKLVGGEGAFLSHATGAGTAIVACYGAMETVNLAAGETITVDSGHVVAYADTLRSQTRRVSKGMIQSAKSGEGLVFDFAGPGQLLTQTRNPAALSAWVRAAGARA